MSLTQSLQNTRLIQQLIEVILFSSLLLLMGCGNIDKSVDTTPPQLSLIGDAKITLLQNQTYQEPGATAQDYTDGNLSNKIIISGKVNSAVTGNYQLKYNVADNTGNAAPELTRSITIQENIRSIYDISNLEIKNITDHSCEVVWKGNVEADTWIHVESGDKGLVYRTDNSNWTYPLLDSGRTFTLYVQGVGSDNVIEKTFKTLETGESSIKLLNLAQLANSVSQTPTAYLKDQFQALVQNSFVENDRDIFVSYSSTGSTVYSSDNWASKFDFSGVGWDSSKCGVLITKKNILLANHYQREINSTIVFHAKDGTRVERKIKNTRSLGNYVSGSNIDKRIFDVAVAELNASVAANIKVYSMLDAGKADGLKDVPAIYTDQTRKVFLEAIKGIYSGDYKNTYKDKNVTDPFIMEAYANDEFTVDYRFMHHDPRGGDSGNPSFLVVNGELVLLSTLTWTEGISDHYGNSIVGPYLLDIEMINYITVAIKEMQAE